MEGLFLHPPQPRGAAARRGVQGPDGGLKRRIILVGATGAFGERLARRLSRWPDIELMLAARGAERLKELAHDLKAERAVASIALLTFDRDRPETLAARRPWAVVDAAGPFQGSDYRLAEAAIAAGAHYVDLADGRDFVAGFPAALDAKARAMDVLAVTGASSTPALSHAALDSITEGWPSVDRVLVAISPGARAPRGLSVVRAVLSYVGRPVRVFMDGGWTTRPGWGLTRRVHFPGVGRRWASLCETPDLDLLPRRFAVRREALFLAGQEQSAVHLGLSLLGWLVRRGTIRNPQTLAEPLRSMAGWIAWMGSNKGGMVVEAEGGGRNARWSLTAEQGSGPYVPVAAAASVLRALVDGKLTERGARVCVGLVNLGEIMMQLIGLPIRSRVASTGP